MQLEKTTAVDTNEEYIIPQNAAKEPPVLKTVFNAIIIDTVKDFFGGIFGFFLRYIKHFFRSFWYLWSPTLKKHPFDQFDYKENCKHSFELALLVLFAIIFMVKLDWIPPTSQNLLDLLNNDLYQMGIQFLMFLLFAACYFGILLASIATGRVFRGLFHIKTTKKESDILFIYLNNALFSITAIIALCVRCITSLQMTDSDTIGNGLSTIFLPLCFVLVVVWAVRFCITNGLSLGKGILFFLLSTLTYTILFTLGCAITAIFFMII